jgi:hypothetical protein
MLNVKVYSEGREHQNVVTPNCPTTPPARHIYLYYSFSATYSIPSKLGAFPIDKLDSILSGQYQLLYHDFFLNIIILLFEFRFH